MDTEMGETGEGTEVLPAQSDGCAKLNGDMNGAYTEKESPMDVSDETTAIVDDERPGKRIVGAAEDVPNSEVPENEPELDEHISSNGFSHDGKENGDSMECDDTTVPGDAGENADSAKVEKEVKDSSVESSSVNSPCAKDDASEKVADDEHLSTENDVSNVSEKEPPPSVTVDKDCTDDKKPEENGDIVEDLSTSKDDKEDPLEVAQAESESNVDKKIVNDTSVEPSVSAKSDDDVKEKPKEALKSDPLETDKKVEAEDDNNDDEETKEEDKSETGDGEDDKSRSCEVIDIDITPEKSKKPRKSVPINVTPRRSSRNLNKQKSYLEKDEKDVDASENAQNSDDPDVEEIEPQDPLAIDFAIDGKKLSKKTTIVVNDTKRLAEIAAGSKPSKGGKKEPTLVIIDTNSILSGRGPVPVSANSSTTITATPMPGPSRSQPHQSPSFSVLPVTLPPASLYSAQALRNQHTTIKPVLVTSPHPPSQAPPQPPPPTLPQIVPNLPQAPPPALPQQKPPVVLPSLTDDMYVVEAPSFIVPYVYEKPPIKPLKEYIEKLEEAIKLQREKDKKAKEEKELKAKELKEKELKEKEMKEKEMKEKEEKEESEKKIVDGEVEKCDKMEVDKDEKEVDKSSDEKMEVDEVKTGEAPDKDKDTTKTKEDESKSDVIEIVKEKVEEEKPKDLTKKEKDDKPVEGGKDAQDSEGGEKKKGGNTYFDNPLGKFFMQIGINLVQEHVQTDLLRSQKRKREREGSKCAPDVQVAINSLLKTLEFSKENNEPFKMELKKCEFCSFKTESQLAMAHHLETPHMRNYVYRCNFCALEVRSPHDILFHMEAEHNVRGRLERAPAFHQCPSCPFEDNQKGKLTRHLLSCAKKYRPERNQEPPLDWEPPAKIPRVPRNRPTAMAPGSALYQAAMTGLKQSAGVPGMPPGVAHTLLPKLMPSPTPMLGQNMLGRGRGRPNLSSRFIPDLRAAGNQMAAAAAHQKAMAAQMRPGMVYRPSGSNAQPQVLLPTSYQIAGNQIYQVVGSQGHGQGGGPMPLSLGGGGAAPRLTLVPPSAAHSPSIASNTNSITIQSSSTSVTASSSSGKQQSQPGQAAAAKLLQQPSISITPLPRPQQTHSSSSSGGSGAGSGSAASSGSSAGASSAPSHGKPGRPLGSGKATFVICEICDGYIKDLELLRNHMQWIHKVKIHPKMIYNRPPLNCQKCQFRFFTDQGLERHLLGSHGLVTSSMQEAANKGKDGGRCPVCGRVYQWKLLNHVARDHNMSLKPAHLSYKCTVCTATFGMYKQFENHVYSAHSVVAKRVMDKKTPSATQPSPSSSQSESLLKPLKINDEITIIPHPPRTKTKPGPASRVGPSSAKGKV